MIFKDRFDAASQLAEKLKKYKNEECVILAIPRGGLQIGVVVAKALQAPLDVVLTKKIGYPGNEEYAIGAVSLKGRILNPDVSDVPQSYIDAEIKRIQSLLQKRHEQYHQGKRKPVDIKNKVVIIVDDGIATGSTVLATIELLKTEKPKKIIVAVPVAPPEAVAKIKKVVDEVVCLHMTADFFAIGQFYENFEQVEDAEAIRLLEEANA